MPILKHSGNNEHIRKSFDTFPTHLEGRMLSIFSSVNTECKALTLASILRFDEGKTGYRIAQEFRALTGGIISPTQSTFDNYCLKTFQPLGLVRIERVKDSKRFPNRVYVRYYLTEGGERYGASIGAFTVQTASEKRRSHFLYLGSTQTTGDTRSPLEKVLILGSLATAAHRFTRVIDHDRNIHSTERRTTTHLQELSKAKLINFSSIDPETEWISYSWKEGADPEAAKKDARIARTKEEIKQKVVDLIFSRNTLMTPREIGDALGYTKDEVSNILIPLRGYEYLISERKAAIKHSDIVITALGEE